MSSNNFEVLALAPAGLSHPGIAVAAARAGGLGLLDVEFIHDGAETAAQFQRLLDATDGAVGIYATSLQLPLIQSLLALAGERALTLVVALRDTAVIDGLNADGRHRLLVEVTSADALAQLPAGVDGIVAKGHESPGWVGEDSSYILLQKLLRATTLPVFVRGGVGINTAAGCRAAGAAGVVLDDQLLLCDDSALPESIRSELTRLTGSETRLFGELLNQPCRLYARPIAPVLKLAEADNRAAEAGELDIAAWRAGLSARIGWNDGELMPVGQGIGAAAIYANRYKRVGKLVQALRKISFERVRDAARLAHLGEGSPLALSHGTRYPLAQGPMTRVSDSPAFAAAVTEAGSLPFLALALMRGDAVLEMLQETQRLAGDKPWGVGMLGFIPQALRDEQCEAIWQCKPAYALIAGGRPDQAAAFEARGVKTYIHAPAPALLKIYLEQGARRFVFEGRECGGHIGPITSFPLWEQMVEVLLENVKPGSESDVHLLFAGGISDAASGAMLAALTAPLAARGMKVGALMGTAYLFTQEIVSSGAVVQTFQDQALACARTVNVETGPGHSTRCADTRFTQDFYDARRQLLRDKRSGDEIRDALEDLNLGRLRVASKGRDRNADGKIVEVPVDQQIATGMYMIGQVATLTDRVLPVAELHRRVCVDSQALLQDAELEVQARIDGARPSDIAIVGIGALLPKAQDVQAYWDNILNQVSGITEIPASRWDWRLYFDADKNARDKIYSKWGGFLDEVMFDPTRYGIPPKSMKAIDPLQLLTLEVVSRALDDANLGDFDRENTSVILGASGGAGELGVQYGVRSELPRFVADLDPGAFDRLPEWSTESFAGMLLNVAAGRVANRMDFGGLNFTVDAACGSSLAALSMAVNELESGRSNVAIAGGVDTTQGPYGFMSFSKTQALSPQGKARTFDKNADGIVVSEGLTMVVLKRLADAERDGDRIYAVIKSVAGSSDGKALGMTAPRPEGQLRALNRAYAKAGFAPSSLGLIEAHGTGTPVGDKAEAESVSRVLAAHGAESRSVALGSVKSLLGHTKACAGMAGLIKLALSMHHRVLPAHAGVEEPLDAIADEASPAYLLKKPRPWLANPDHTPRRGGVSAFGFGGTNFHAVVEEYRGGFGQRETAGSSNWTQELIVLRAADAAALRTEVDRLLGIVRTASRLRLADFAYSLAREADKQGGARAVLAFATRDLKTLVTDLEAASRVLGGDAKPLPPHIKLTLERPAAPPKLAFIFPGQGAQYVDMGAEPALFIEDLRSGVERADRVLHGLLPERLSRRLWPESAFNADTEAAQLKRLTDTRYAQPAIGALELGYLSLARRLGVEAVATAGHSYGEFAALHAAGVYDADSFLRLSAVRGRVMAEAATSGIAGGMAAVQAPREQVAAQIAAFEGVKVANHNAPKQTVISGPAAAVDQAIAALSAAGLRTIKLPVSGAFHTELMASAQAPLSQAIAQTEFAEPRLAVYSNGSGGRYPQGVDAIRKQLDAHLLSSVEFVQQIETLYADGVRLFLELGPKSICSNMIGDTLAGRDARSLSLDGQGGGLRGLLTGLADLLVLGVDVQLSRLFDGRSLQALALPRLAELVQPLPVPATAWYLTGGYARAAKDAKPFTGIEPSLSLEASKAAKQAIVQKIIDAAPNPAPVIMQAPQLAASSNAAAMPAAPVAVSGSALASYHETMRQFLALQERVITQYLGAPTAPVPNLPAIPPAAPIAAAAVVASAAPAVVASAPLVQAVAPVAFDLSATLLKLVSDRTGYPEDMLSLDADLEADLGIDSIKRVEIIGALEKAIPAPLAAAMQSQMERYTRAKSLRAILEPLSAISLPSIAASHVPAVAIQVAAVASTPAVDHRSLLLNIVAERTGYPTEMLALDADLEADLGIDSIKRVEIIGALEKQVAPATAEAMRASMERFTRAKTLSVILDRLQELAPAALAVSVAATVTSPVAAPVASGVVDYRALLLNIVAERTGYPTEMLALDADLEADLGIDSIKRVEIIGALEKQVAPATAEAMRASMERFTRAKTLSVILERLAELAPAAAPGVVSAAVQVTIAPIATAASIVVDHRSLLLNIVAERTGYPTEMLALDADLEADLGIDSIKRVEIIGALEKQVAPATAEAMRAAMERFTRAKTLGLILERLGDLTPAAAKLAPQVSLSAVSPVTAVAVDHRVLLLNIVAERTGYPTEMLALDADLEADLGIDSIKRVEIIGALEKQVAPATAEAMRASMERFTRAKTLAVILERLAALAEVSPAVSAIVSVVQAQTSVAPVIADEAEPVPRYVIRPRPAPLPSGRIQLAGTVIVAGGPDRIVNPLLARLSLPGVQVLRITAHDDAAIEKTVSAARAAGTIAGLIHLHGLCEDQPQTLEAWRDLGDRTVLSLFRLIKHLGSDLAKARVIAATRLGGTFGRDAVGPGTPVAGGVIGLLNCAREEYPDATLRAVDFNGQTDETIASHLLDELVVVDRAPESGHTGDARYSVATVEEALTDTPFAPHLQPAAGWVVMATGGARGITAELLEEMAVPGIHLVLLGRTAEPLPEEASLTAATDAAALKKLLLGQARARGEMPKPVDIDRAVTRVLTDREIRANLAKLRARGAIVDYQACDVRDPASFGAVIDGLYTRHGRIDAVLHGAGVIEDKRIADKTDESFARVFGTKLDSSFILTQKLRPETLKLLVFFTSVAGRYGNSGQIDYAAANEAVNRLAWTLSRRWTETRVIAANWGPWDAGMASEAVKQKLRERGMEPIPVLGGRRYFLRELACGPKHEVEIVIGRGPWGALDGSQPAVSAAPTASVYPLLRSPLRMGAGGALVLSHAFGIPSDPYLADQMIGGKPLLPASVAAEWIAQVVAQGWPGWQVAEIVDLRRTGDMRLDAKKARELEFRARATSHSGPGEQTVVVDIAEPGRKSTIYRASVRLVERLEVATLSLPAALGAGATPDLAQSYQQWLFHQGRFRVISQLLAVDASGIDARVQPSLVANWLGASGEWLFDPALIDAATQLVGIWSGVNRQVSALPTRFGRIVRNASQSRSAGALTLRLRVRSDFVDGALAYDSFVIDEAGRVLLAVLDSECSLGLDPAIAGSGQA